MPASCGRAPSPSDPTSSASATPAPTGGTDTPPAVTTATEIWTRLLKLTANSGRTQSMLRAAKPISWEGQKLTVEIAGAMRAVLQHRTDELEKLLRSIARSKVVLVVREPEAKDDAPQAELPPDAKTLAEGSDVVKHAMSLFNGRVEHAHLKKKP